MTLKYKWVSSVVIFLVFAVGFVVGQSRKSGVPDATSTMVGVYVESVARQINIKDLQARYPGNTAQKIDPAALRADAIVGWYDKGNNFHAQKMENNINKTIGAERIFPEILKGSALRGMVQK